MDEYHRLIENNRRWVSAMTAADPESRSAPCVQQAWARARRPLLHGVVYDIDDGLLPELVRGVDSQEAADALAWHQH